MTHARGVNGSIMYLRVGRSSIADERKETPDVLVLAVNAVCSSVLIDGRWQSVSPITSRA